MYYKPKYFKTQELVPDKVYEKWGDIALQFMDAGLLHDLDIIREILLEPVYVNIPNLYNWSGLRTQGSKYYSRTSQHTLGNAIDFRLGSWINEDLTTRPPETVRQLIKDLKQKGLLSYITAMEENTSNWIHIDTRNRAPNDTCGLFLFNP